MRFVHTYENIISMDNLLGAWKEFLKGKRGKQDVQEFQYRLSDNILALHNELTYKTYIHGGYYAFNISDPKPRNIHKASVRDRLLHHAIYRQFYPFFGRTFISDSYSCRKEKGTHRAMNTFRQYTYQMSKNNTKTLWVLKCDIRKFFASVDQTILMDILRSYISDDDILWLIGRVVESFSSTQKGKGLPLGNLTSQLLVNIYMNEFDQFAKHTLKAKHYIRYSDDFVFLSQNRMYLFPLLPSIQNFLHKRLSLELHPDKVFIKTLASDADFLGWVHFFDHRVLRTSTKKRMFRTLQSSEGKPEVLFSYLGMLSHGNTQKLKTNVISIASLPSGREIC